MLFSSMKLSSHHLPINTTTSTPALVSMVGYVRTTLGASQLTFGVSLVKKNSHSSGVFISSKREGVYRLIKTSIHLAETLQLMKCHVREAGADLSTGQVLTEDFPGDYSNVDEDFDCTNGKEVERRRKIGLANSGRVPWNKGRKHSPETRERIRQRTKEALSDPKVRKKMSECPRVLSNQTKKKIRSSLRKVWGERLKWKRSREKFLQSWAESIAQAAKIGGSDQGELEWDSYDKINREIALQQLQLAAEKAKAKEMARIRAERAAQRKTEKMLRLALRKKEREEKQKTEGETKRPRKKSKQEKEELAVAEELKLKAKLVKIHKKKSLISHVRKEDQRAWESIDVGFIEKAQVQKTVSLADQIRLAKKRGAGDVNGKAVTLTSSIEISPE